LFHRQKAKVNVDNAFAGFTNTAHFKILARVNSNKNKMGGKRQQDKKYTKITGREIAARDSPVPCIE
jgi:hypothetical protein